MNLTLTAISAAVVTACFVTTGPVKNEPVFPTQSVVSEEHIEVNYYAPFVETVDSYGEIDIYLNPPLRDAPTVTASTSGYFSYGYEDPVLIYKVQEVSSTARCWAVLNHYDLQYCRAYFKRASGANPYEVFGYYGRTVVFGSTININAYIAPDVLTSQGDTDAFFYMSIPNTVAPVLTTFENIQTYAKFVDVSALHTLLTDRFMQDPYVLYQELTGISHGLSTAFDTLVPLTIDHTVPAVLETVQTQSAFSMMPYKLVEACTVSVTTTGDSLAYSKHATATAAVELSSTGVCDYHVIQGIPHTVYIAESSADTLAIMGIRINISGENSVTSSGEIDWFYIAPYVGEDEVISNNLTGLFYKKEEPFILNEAQTAGQSDIRYGDFIMISRTEPVHSTLDAITLVYNPGIDHVSNNVTTSHQSQAIAGQNKTTETASEDVDSEGALSLEPYILTEPLANGSNTTFENIVVVVKDVSETGHIETLSSAWAVSIVVDRAAYPIVTLTTAFATYCVAKDATASELLGTLSTAHTLTEAYEPPVFVPDHVDIVSTSGTLSAFAIGPFTSLNTVQSNLDNIQLRVKDSTATGLYSTLSSTHVIDYFKTSNLFYLTGTLSTTGVLTLEPYKLFNPGIQTLASEFAVTTYNKESLLAPVVSVVVTDLGNIQTANGLRVLISDCVNSTTTSGYATVCVDRLTEAVNNTLNTSNVISPIGGQNSNATPLHTVSSSHMINTEKQDCPTVSHNVTTTGYCTVHVEDLTPTPINTLSSSGQTDVWFEAAVYISRTEPVNTTLGALTTFRNPGLNVVLNTLSTTNVSEIVGGSNKTPSSLINTMSSSHVASTEKNDCPVVLHTLTTTLVVDISTEYINLTGILNTAATTGVCGAFAKSVSMTGVLNTTSTTLGAFTEEHVAPVTITLDKQLGTGGTSSIVTVAGFSITPASITPPTRTHFTFDGYYTLAAGGTQIINSSGTYVALEDDTFTSAVTLYAHWTDVVYTILWKSYANVTLKTDNLIAGSTSTAPTGTTDTAQYDYAWPQSSITVSGNQTITETRTLKSYLITWYAYSGATLKSETLTYGSTSTAPTGTTNTTQYTYTWPKSSTTVVGTESITETRTTNSYTITWNDYDGGAPLKQETLTYGSTSNAPVGTTDTAQWDYSWPKASTTVLGNETITETRVVISYTILFVNFVGTTVSTQVLAYGSAPSVPATTADTAQWNYSWPSVPTVTGPATYNETRILFQYLITWKSYTNATLKSETLDYGATSTAPLGTTDTTEYDYSWPKGSTTVVGIETITETRTAKSYTLTFNANTGGTPSPTTKTVTFASTYGTLATITKTNWAFLGWYTAASGGTLITSGTTVTLSADHTVYAHWNPAILPTVLNTCATSGSCDIHYESNTVIGRVDTVATALGDMQLDHQTAFIITLNTNGGTGGTTTISGQTGVSITPTSITPATRTNYTITGYWTATSGGTKYINADGTYNGLDSNTYIGLVTLYAQWTMNNLYFDWNPTPNTIGLRGDVSIGGALQEDNSLDWYQQRAANSVFKISGLTIPAGWAYSTYSTSNLVSVSVGGSGATTEVQGTGDMASTSGRAIAITVAGITYNITVNQNSGTGSSASVSTYIPKTTTTVITMTRGTRTNYQFTYWTVSGANGQAVVTGDTITIPVYTTTVQPYGDLTITANWHPTTATALNTTTTTLGDAQYETVAPITITLDKQSGTGGDSSIISVAGFYLNPTSITAPTRTGYTFNGYYTATSGGTQRINSSGVYVALTNSTYVANATLYAQWSVITYTLTNDRNGGTGGNSSATYNITTSATIAALLGSPTKTGYTLANWKWTSASSGGWANLGIYSTSQNVIGKYATGTLQVQWTANTYTVTFNANGGGTPSPTSKSVTYGSAYGTLATVSRTNWVFTGWFTSAPGGSLVETTTTVATASDHTLYAHWTPTLASGNLNTLSTTLGDAQTEYAEATYNITTQAGTGVATLSVNPTTYQHNATTPQNITITQSASAGYTLNTATITRLGTYGGSTPTVSGNTVTIPAGSWGAFRVDQTATANSFVITLDANGGNSGITEEIAVTYNTSLGSWVSTMAPTRTGYTFNGFYTATSGGTQRINNSGAYVALTSVTYTTAATLYAQWTAISSTVTFNANGGGTPSPTSKVVTYGSTYGTLASVSRTGYTLNGWYTASSGGSLVTSGTTVTATANHTLYAQWTANSFVITLDANGGTAGSNTSIDVVYATSLEAFATTMRPYRASYLFNGFYTASSGGSQVISPTAYVALTNTTYTSATTLYAQWTSAPNFPTVRSSTSGSISTAALTLTVTLPTGHAAGDLLIIGVSLDGSRTMSAPAGWTLLANPTGYTASRHAVWYKTRGASESNPAITWSTTSEIGTWYSIAITAGTWQGTPEIATSIATSSTPTPTTLTPTWGYSKALWLSLFGWDYNRTSSTTPTNYTLMTYQAGSSTASAGHRTFYRQYEAPINASGSITLSASDETYTHTVAIKPAAASSQTATPTVGAHSCLEDELGDRFGYISVTNNDASTVSVYIDGDYVGTLNASQTSDFLFASYLTTPHYYNINVTAQASGKTLSAADNASGSITFCMFM